ncbi:MAG: excisionase family DNA-binding protein [Gammaproteobacteria bacterium]|nr:excisionase family DNA-binding protein [Gammaproteobacteria bacterium]
MKNESKPSQQLVRNLLDALPLGDYFTPGRLASQLRWPVSRVLAAIDAGELPARRVGGEWLLSKEALNAYFRATDQGGPCVNS